MAAMEDVLEVYHRPYDSANPVVCMDEASKQLIGEVRDPLPMRPGQVEKYDSEYKRLGTANIFIAVEPLAGQRTTQVTDRRTKLDWAQFIRHLLENIYPNAEKVILVLDNLNTHTIGSLYEAFDAETARNLANRLEIHYTPKHGSWLPPSRQQGGRNRTERTLPPVSGSPRRQQRENNERSRYVGKRKKQSGSHHQLAIHHSRRPNQTQETLSLNSRLTEH